MLRKVVASLVLLSAVAVATPANAETTAEKDPNKVVCKKIYPTGSRTRVTKVCATQAEWDAEARDSGESVKNMQGKAGVGGGGAQNPFSPGGQ